jgi:hypothetical protein
VAVGRSGEGPPRDTRHGLPVPERHTTMMGWRDAAELLVLAIACSTPTPAPGTGSVRWRPPVKVRVT